MQFPNLLTLTLTLTLTTLPSLTTASPTPSRQEGTEWNVPNPLASFPAQILTVEPYRTFIPAASSTSSSSSMRLRNVKRGVEEGNGNGNRNDMERMFIVVIDEVVAMGRSTPPSMRLVTRGVSGQDSVQKKGRGLRDGNREEGEEMVFEEKIEDELKGSRFWRGIGRFLAW